MESLANKGFRSNAGFVVTGQGVVVFDALGTPALGLAMREPIRKVTDGPIRRIVVSHYDAVYLRESMARAVRDLESFEAAYAKTDWSRFKSLPAFEDANRINAYGTYLLLEEEELRSAKP